MCKLQSFLHVYEYLQTYSGPVSAVSITHSGLVLKINLMFNMLKKIGLIKPLNKSRRIKATCLIKGIKEINRKIGYEYLLQLNTSLSFELTS